MSDRHDLSLLLGSGVPLVVVETTDETRLLKLLTELAIERAAADYRPLYRWSVTDGLQRLDLDLEPQRHTVEPRDVLGHIRSVTKPGVYVLLDFHPFLNDPVNVRLLKDVALQARATSTVVVLASHRIDLPSEFSGLSARFDLRVPDATERRRIVMRVIAEYQQQESGRRVAIDPRALEMLIENLSGLDHADTERLARAAIVDDGAIDHNDIPQVMEAKYRLLNASGALHFEYDTVQFADVAGFGNIRRWLEQRRTAFTANHPQALDPPKGILLLGVQGCGKSLAAKAAASVLGLPLLRLDIGTLYNKFHGETERNLREALRTAETLSPCVLWLDEIEKAVAADDHDSGTSRRVLGTLLTWMNERRSRVLLVATANDIQSLPPELVRKGRFDEIFFVDLPNADQRRAVLEIHLRKRGQDPAQFDCAALARTCEGFSGAEIEQAVVAALYAAHAQEKPLSLAHLVREIRTTRPLSVLMAERVTALRAWASTRTVPADDG